MNSDIKITLKVFYYTSYNKTDISSSYITGKSYSECMDIINEMFNDRIYKITI